MRLWVALDVHKFSIVAAMLPPVGGTPEVHRIETTEKAIRRFVGRLGGPDGLAMAYDAGPGGFDLLRLLRRIGVWCDVIAPSLVPGRAGDRIKTDRAMPRSSCGSTGPASWCSSPRRMSRPRGCAT